MRVHGSRLARGVGPVDLSPSEALRMADEGRESLRRELPPDPEGSRAEGS